MFFYALLIAFQVWAIVDCLRRRSRSLWVVAVLLFGPFGALAYVVSEALRGRWGGVVPMPAAIGRDPRDEARIREIEAQLVANPAPALLVELGDLHARGGDSQAAADAYGRSLEADPDGLYARYHLGRALTALGQHADALLQLQQVHAADPKYDYGAAAEALADALLAAGRADDALGQYAEIAETSARARPKFQLGLLLDRVGRRDEARRVMQEVADQAEAIPAYLRAGEMPWVERARQYLESAPPDPAPSTPAE